MKNMKDMNAKQQNTQAFRMNAKSALKEKIKRKEVELSTLQILHKVIPWDGLCKEDEEKLWGYFMRVNK